MSKKLVVFAFCIFMFIALSADIYAGAIVRWAGNYAGTRAATYVPGGTPPICIDTKGGAVPPALTSFCYGSRPAPAYGGAWGFAYANIVSGRRISIAFSGTYGPATFAGKAAEDTTRCSTYVEIIPNGGTFDLSLYSYLESPLEVNRVATCDLEVVAEGNTLFHGAINFTGNEANSQVVGEFNTAPIVYGPGNATIEHIFPAVDLAGYDPDLVEIIVTSDSKRIDPIPSMNIYGAMILVILLLAAGLYLYRRRRIRKAIV